MNIKINFKTIIAIYSISIFMLPSLSLAHDGSLDSYGCHHDRKQGGYHCHSGEFAGEVFSSKDEMLNKIRTRRVQEYPPTQSIGKKHLIEAQIIRIIDGDTMEVSINGQKEKVRLIGVDTPEIHESQKLHRDAQRTGKDEKTIRELGAKASSFAKSLVKKGDLVRLEYDWDKRDKYDRILAFVWLEDGRMLNETIICSGYGNAYTLFPFKQEYMDRFLACHRMGFIFVINRYSAKFTCATRAG